MLRFLQCNAHFLQRNEGCANVTAISAIYVTVHVHTYVQSYQNKDLNKTHGMVTNHILAFGKQLVCRTVSQTVRLMAVAGFSSVATS